MEITNSQCIKILKSKKHINENLRYEIVFLDTLHGICNAREKYPDKFIPQKQVTNEVLESEEIAKQRQKTLELIDKKGLDYIIKQLSKSIYSKLEKIEFPDDPFYNNIKLFMERKELRYICGRDIERNLGEGLIKRILYNEFTLISRVIREKDNNKT